MAVTYAVIGSTGLVGSNILSALLAAAAAEKISPVYTISRRPPHVSSSLSLKLKAIVTADSSQWASILISFNPAPSVVFSALGTTTAAAGSVENQWKIDHDLNVELVKAARLAGANTFVFISSAGVRSFPTSMMAYCKMKRGVEDAIKEQGFSQAIILRPGMILGSREEKRAAESMAQSAVRWLGHISETAQNIWGQDAEVIARAAIKAAQLAAEDKVPDRYWVIEGAEIVRLGRKDMA